MCFGFFKRRSLPHRREVFIDRVSMLAGFLSAATTTTLLVAFAHTPVGVPLLALGLAVWAISALFLRPITRDYYYLKQTGKRHRDSEGQDLSDYSEDDCFRF